MSLRSKVRQLERELNQPMEDEYRLAQIALAEGNIDGIHPKALAWAKAAAAYCSLLDASVGGSTEEYEAAVAAYVTAEEEFDVA